MAATFDRAAVYHITATCQTPFRTADAVGDVGKILRYDDGTAIVQAASIAGALRSWIRENMPEHEQLLFGGSSGKDAPVRQGSLIISDGIFEKTMIPVLRPRVRIDKATGTAADGQKFDMAHVPTGQVFLFTIVWTGNSNASIDTELHAIRNMLGAMHYGEICLGGQKSNGFGRVELEVKERLLDMTDRNDRTAWMEDDTVGMDITQRLPIPVQSQISFEFNGKTDSILVKDPVPRKINRQGKETYVGNILENNRAVIPGSALKGCIRSRCEMIAQYCFGDTTVTDTIFGCGADGKKDARPGLVRVEDVCLDEQNMLQFSRIRINRFTAGVISPSLFTEAALNSKISFKLKIPAAMQQGCILLFYALRDLGLGLYTLGSGDSVGRGRVHGAEILINAPSGQTAKITFDGTGGYTLEDRDGLVKSWMQCKGAEV